METFSFEGHHHTETRKGKAHSLATCLEVEPAVQSLRPAEGMGADHSRDSRECQGMSDFNRTPFQGRHLGKITRRGLVLAKGQHQWLAQILFRIEFCSILSFQTSDKHMNENEMSIRRG